MRALRATAVAVLVLGCDPSRPARVRPDAGACPAVFGAAPSRVLLDATCFAGRCEALAEQRGCDLRIEVSGCADGVLEGVVGADGTPVFAASNTFGTCDAVAPPSGAVLAAECRIGNAPCRADAYAPGAVLAGDVASLPLFDVPFVAPEGSAIQPLDTRDPLQGYIADAVHLAGGATLLVSTYDGEYGSIDCDTTERSRLFFVDTFEPSLVGTATAPPCLTRLASDPLSDGFLGVYGSTAPRLGRFDGRGVLLTSVPLGVPDDGERRYCSAFMLKGHTYAQLFFNGHEPDGTGYLLVVDIATLATTSVSPRTAGDHRHAALVGTTLVAASDRFGAEVHFFAADDATPAGALELAASRRLSDKAGFLLHDTTSGRLLVTSAGKNAGVWIVPTTPSSGEVLGTAAVYEEPGVLWAMLQRPDGVIAGVTGPAPEYPASLVRLRAGELRFLPGLLPVGAGVVSRILQAEGGAMMVILPWSASIARVTLAE